MLSKKVFSVVILTMLIYFLISVIFPFSWSFPGLPEKDFKYGLDLQGGARLIYEADVSEVSMQDKDSALEGIRDVIERRINAFGIAEPRVFTKTGGTNPRLIVELPGIKNIDEALQQIGETPVLEFKERTSTEDLAPEGEEELNFYNQAAQRRAVDVLEKIRAGEEDFATLAKEYSEDPGSKEKGGDLGWFRRGAMVIEFEEAAFALEEGEITDNLIKSDFGYHLIQKTGEREEGEEIKASHILIKTKIAEEFLPLWKTTGLTGRYLDKAAVAFDQTTGSPKIELSFNEEGAKIFEEITARNIKQPLAIFLDGKAIVDTDGDGEITDTDLYAPTVENKISGGKAVITGDLDITKAKEIVSRLKSGALPVPIELISQKTIGPTLGKTSLDQSLWAGLIGLAAMVLFMLIFYRFPGFLASLALAVFAMIILALFKFIPVTLTLAGIGGAILSIGMAVDANILIFERMKEELKEGRELKQAISAGVKRAWPSIRDGNMTTLLVAIIMFWFGTSFIKGFSITLSLGVLVSVFSALWVTPTLLRLFENTRLAKIKKLWQ